MFRLKNISLVTYLIIAMSCDQKKKDDQSFDSSSFDSSYAVVPHDTINRYYLYKVGAIFGVQRITSLTQKDLATIDSLFNVCITDYNNSEKDGHLKIDLSKRSYKKQLIAVLNYYGQKSIWVNCFCDVTGMRWRTELVEVRDGGNCFLHFKVNLTTKKYYELSVNGDA